jgi:N12 class adenine-specific DNA methylase
VDVPYIARQCLCSLAEVLTTLKGLIYETPVGTYVTAEEYLLGDVRRKLREAERAAECNPAFAKNVAALQAVQPANLGQEEIIVRLGAGWVPESMITWLEAGGKTSRR